MLKLNVVGEEFYDENTSEFITLDGFVLELEHSLVSLSKWESKYQKPFLAPGEKTDQEILDYVQAMIISSDTSENVIDKLSKENLDLINDYISSEQSATTFNEPAQQRAKGRGEIVTSELIYFWMVSYGVPFECQTWHLNRLLALLRICNIKNSKQKKMSKGEIAARNRELNEQRRAQMNTKG